MLSQAATIPKKKRIKSKSGARNRQKSLIRADAERSRSGLRDCCQKKQEAVKNETVEQLNRIAEQQRKYSPMQS